MTTIINNYIEIVRQEALDYIDDCGTNYTDWDDLWDDMTISVTGNDGSRKNTPKNLIHDIVWESEFIQYCAEACTEVGEIMTRGESVVDCMARYCMLDYYLNDELYNYWNDNNFAMMED